MTPPILGHFWLRGRYDIAYRERIAERFGRCDVPERFKGGIVVHTVSVGECVAATPLIEMLLSRHPEWPITVTCTTPTASRRILATFGDRVFHCYFPLDLPAACRHFLEQLQPQCVIVLETELWPNFLHQCSCSGVKVVLANARLSARSARRYMRWKRCVRKLLENLTLVLTQNHQTDRRFGSLGVDKEKRRCVGSLKYEQIEAATRQRFVWVLASTHAGEDEQLLEAARQVIPQIPELLIIWVPRHPERFDKVAAMLLHAGVAVARRSLQQAIEATTHVYLADTMGEMPYWFARADLVFIGGSLIERGGHNPLEAALFAKPVQTGPHVFNFSEIYRELDNAGAVYWAKDSQALADATLHLYHTPDELKQDGVAAQACLKQRQGALKRSLDAIESVMLSQGVQEVKDEG
jgi:3-deoxy-D-manno-octulosonic-acid transferase